LVLIRYISKFFYTEGVAEVSKSFWQSSSISEEEFGRSLPNLEFLTKGDSVKNAYLSRESTKESDYSPALVVHLFIQNQLRNCILLWVMYFIEIGLSSLACCSSCLSCQFSSNSLNFSLRSAIFASIASRDEPNSFRDFSSSSHLRHSIHPS